MKSASRSSASPCLVGGPCRILNTVPEQVQQAIAGHLPSGKLPTPDDVVNAIVFLCSTANGDITNQTLRVTGGL